MDIPRRLECDDCLREPSQTGPRLLHYPLSGKAPRGEAELRSQQTANDGTLVVAPTTHANAPRSSVSGVRLLSTFFRGATRTGAGA